MSRYENIKQDSEQQFSQHNKELEVAVNKKTDELRIQKEMFESLFQKSYDGLLLIENKKFVECNDAIVKMLGYKNKIDLLNTHPSELSQEYQPDGELSSTKADKMMQICVSNDAHNFEWVHQRADGDNFWCDVTLTHLTLQDRELIHTVWRDITEKKELESELKQKDEIMLAQSRQAAMGDMISMIAHQWRQPITAIGMGAQNIQLDIELEDIDLERFNKKLDKIFRHSLESNSSKFTF